MKPAPHQTQALRIPLRPAGADAFLAFARGLTPRSEHDYLTKAQIWWSRLIDRGDIDAAERFALDLFRSAPEEHLDEVREIVRETFQWSWRHAG